MAAAFRHGRSGLFCQSLKKLMVSGASWSGQLRSGPIAQRWDRQAHAEHAIGDSGDDVIVDETVQGMHEVRPATERVAAACTNTHLQGQFNWADRGGATSDIEVAGHCSGQEDGGRPNQWGVCDFEVVVIEREGTVTDGRQRPEPQALERLRLLSMRAPRATGGPRGHETPLAIVNVVDSG